MAPTPRNGLGPTKYNAVVIVDSPTHGVRDEEDPYEFNPGDDLMVDDSQTRWRPNPYPEEPTTRWRSDGGNVADDATVDEGVALESTVLSSL
ncbi:OLC1v1012340C1 [Oldenlandia corymbosa var. corymbosa]|uniref:OLC1v1012340C1 n=1 Tax=Oldenlandia corymbosa var. corymbosa TaxID=529605 RepID=A0AAV1DVV3_OLDCO|nr:OLC1v1012340C1 [Oldenlandia corymbosa var. corymbosa]